MNDKNVYQKQRNRKNQAELETTIIKKQEKMALFDL